MQWVTRLRPLALGPMSTHYLLSYALLANFVYRTFHNHSARLTPFLEAHADVRHRWFGWLAATRMRSQFMASIYDKAWKRKAYSGIVVKWTRRRLTRSQTVTKKRDPKASTEPELKANDPKAGADGWRRKPDRYDCIGNVFSLRRKSPHLISCVLIRLIDAFKVHSRSLSRVPSFITKS